jgi:hypothetical protein
MWARWMVIQDIYGLSAGGEGETGAQSARDFRGESEWPRRNLVMLSKEGVDKGGRMQEAHRDASWRQD